MLCSLQRTSEPCADLQRVVFECAQCRHRMCVSADAALPVRTPCVTHAQSTCFAGTQLKSLLAFMGIYAVPANCSCNARVALMDAWGCDECERRIDEIVGWLREEAGKRGLPFIDVAGRMLVRRAIRNARKAAAADA